MSRKLRGIIAAVVCALVALCMVGCASAKKDVELEIYAANSLSKALDEVQGLYHEKNPNITFADTQYEASGTLVEKMKAGGQPDIFISASKNYMDQAIEAGYVQDGKQFNMFTNDLVIVTGENNDAISEITLEEAVSGKYTIAVGDENVPAGNYARQAMSFAKQYSSDTGKGGEYGSAIADKITLGDKVGSVCKYAESGEVDLAFVYSSDVYRFGGVKVVCTVPADAHKDIIYPASVTTMSDSSEEAAAFLKWAYEDPEAIKIWQKWGFEVC